MTFFSPDQAPDNRRGTSQDDTRPPDGFEARLASNPVEAGIRVSFLDCQKIISELLEYQEQLDALDGSLKVSPDGLRKWREEARAIAVEFKEVNDRINRMRPCPEKMQLRIQCVEATLRFLEGRFRILFQDTEA